MGFLDFLTVAAGVVDILSGKPKYTITCEILELFEAGTTWVGTARVHGAGRHLSTEHVNFSTSFEDNGPEDAREKVRKWAEDSFANGGSLPKGKIILNEYEDCLSCDGFVKKVNGKWTMQKQPTNHYASFKLYVTRENKALGYDELKRVFIAPTTARITNVDVHDGF